MFAKITPTCCVTEWNAYIVYLPTWKYLLDLLIMKPQPIDFWLIFVILITKLTYIYEFNPQMRLDPSIETQGEYILYPNKWFIEW